MGVQLAHVREVYGSLPNLFEVFTGLLYLLKAHIK